MNTSAFLSALAASLIGISSLHANSLLIPFDSPEDLARVSKKAKVGIVSDNKVAGAGALSIRCDSDASGCRFDLPQASQGVVSFWIYDPVLETRERIDRGFEVTATMQEGGKPKAVSFWLHSGMGDDNWYYRDSAGVRDLDFYVRRHRGWTRFDVVNPPGGGPRPFLIYIDGRLAGKTPTQYTGMTSVVMKSFWGTGTILVDEFAFNDDVAAFKPNVLQAVHAGEDEANTVALGADDPLRFAFSLAPSGANAKAGKLNLRLMDGSETEISRQSVEIDWEKQKGDLTVEVQRPPHSGFYWVEASYEDAGTRVPQRLLERFDLQFHSKGFDTRGRSIVLAKPWDWLPVGEKAPYRVDIPTPASAPAAPPSDWSAARQIKGVWNRDFNLTYQTGWYHRKITVPREWGGSPITLDIDEPQTIATVYVNQANAGEIEWPGGTLDLTRHLEAGKTYDLSIFVRAEAMAGYNRVMREIQGDSFKSASWVSMRGLRGKVELRADPKGASITRSALTANATGGQLEVSVFLEKLKPGVQYTLRSSVSAAGQTALAIPDQTFTATSPTLKASFKVPWKDAQRWDIGTPFLYDFHAMLCEKGRPVDIRPPERFGFRELKFDGRLVKLNGRTINLSGPFTTQFNAFGTGAALKEMHASFNFTCGFRHAVVLGAGDSALRDYADFCANAGIGADVRLGWLYTKRLIGQNKENDPRYWAFFEKVVRYYADKYGNNPGVFFWAELGSQLDMGSSYNPLLKDGLWNRDLSNTPELDRLAKVQKRAVGIIRGADPTRPIVGQNTGSFLDVAHITYYPGFAPIQELIEADDYWVANGVKPLFYTEWAAPFIFNWANHTREQGHGTEKVIPYEAEWCAITKGDRAFARTALDEKILAGFEAKRKWSAESYLMDDAGNLRNEVTRERFVEQIFNWRANGIGLLITQYFHDLGHQMPETLDTALKPVTGFISGPAENRRDKTHIYEPGETLNRGLTLLNNSAQARKVRYQWKVEFGGKQAGSEEQVVEIPAGETLHLPIRCPVAAEADCEGKLSMSLTDAADGQKIRDEEVTLNVLAPRPFQSAGKIALIDPEGDSAKALKRAGVDFRQVPFTMDLRGFDTVIFGRRAFDYEMKASEKGIDLGKLLQAGKRVIVLEQSEECLRKRFKLRTEYISPRIVYGREFKTGLFDGLPDGCLQFWRGESTLTDGYAIARETLKPRQNEGNGGKWHYLWNDGTEHNRPIKWGNRHNVATVVVIKPDTGAFRTLADCEFGLNYAAAWQLRQGTGTMVFSQIDASGRSEAAPEASRYLQNLVRYTAALPRAESRAAVFLGNEKQALLLERLGVPFAPVQNPAQADPLRHVLILGDVPEAQLMAWKGLLDRFATAGGVIFSLPKTAETLAAAWTPVKLGAVKKEINHTVLGKSADPLVAGLGNSDFYWKGNIAATALEHIAAADFQTGNGLLARVPQGRGCWIFCQFEPSMLDANPDRFWLKDSKRYAERTLRTLLSNLDVAMTPPDLLQPPAGGPSPLFSTDLAGEWQCGLVNGETPESSPMAQVKLWKKVSLPGSYRGKATGWEPAQGSIWYMRNFELPKLSKEVANARLQFSAAEGIDTVFINGKPVGGTSRITNPDDLSTALRDYAVPVSLLKPGVNEIAVFVQFDTGAPLSPGNGNLVAPVWLRFFPKAGVAADQDKAVRGPYLYDLGKSDDPYMFCEW